MSNSRERSREIRDARREINAWSGLFGDLSVNDRERARSLNDNTRLLRAAERNMAAQESYIERQGGHQGFMDGVGHNGGQPAGRYSNGNGRQAGVVYSPDDSRGGRDSGRDYGRGDNRGAGRGQAPQEAQLIGEAVDILRDGVAGSEANRPALAANFVRTIRELDGNNDNQVVLRDSITIPLHNGQSIQFQPGTYSVGDITNRLGTSIDPDGVFQPHVITASQTAGPASNNAPSRAAAPTVSATSITGNGNTVDIATSQATGMDRVAILVNSNIVTRNGQPMTTGERLEEAVQLIDSSIKGLTPSPTSAAEAGRLAVAFADPAMAANMQKLYDGADEAGRRDFRAAMGGLSTTVGTIDPSLRAPVDAFLARLESPTQTSAEQARSQAENAARIAAFRGIQFTPEFMATEAGQEAKKDYDAILQQQEAMNKGGNGGPFGSFFMQLFTMIGNVLSGNPERNQSPEDFLASLPENSITADGQRTLANIRAGQVPAATPANGQQPATGLEGSATRDTNGGAVPAPPAPPAPTANAQLLTTLRSEITRFDGLSSEAIVVVPPNDQRALKDRMAAMGFDTGAPDVMDLTKMDASIRQIETLIDPTKVDGKLDARIVAILNDPQARDAIQQARQANVGGAQHVAENGGPATSPDASQQNQQQART